MSKIYSNLSIIVAVGRNLEIGCRNKLLCHLPNDLKYFKLLTLDSTVVMGENTYHSLPRKPLPHRRNVVLTDRVEAGFPDCLVVHSVDEVLWVVSDDPRVFIIGGASVYRQFMSFASRLFVTQIEADFPEADVFFPTVDPQIWTLTQSTPNPPDEKHPYAYEFRVFKRK